MKIHALSMPENFSKFVTPQFRNHNQSVRQTSGKHVVGGGHKFPRAVVEPWRDLISSLGLFLGKFTMFSLVAFNIAIAELYIPRRRLSRSPRFTRSVARRALVCRVTRVMKFSVIKGGLHVSAVRRFQSGYRSEKIDCSVSRVLSIREGTRLITVFGRVCTSESTTSRRWKSAQSFGPLAFSSFFFWSNIASFLFLRAFSLKV